MIIGDDGTYDFRALRSKRRGSEVVLYAFDLLEHDGCDLRDLPLIGRKRRLARTDRQGQAASRHARQTNCISQKFSLLVPDAVNRRPNFRTSIDRSWSLSMPIT